MLRIVNVWQPFSRLLPALKSKHGTPILRKLHKRYVTLKASDKGKLAKANLNKTETARELMDSILFRHLDTLQLKVVKVEDHFKM